MKQDIRDAAESKEKHQSHQTSGQTDTEGPRRNVRMLIICLELYSLILAWGEKEMQQAVGQWGGGSGETAAELSWTSWRQKKKKEGKWNCFGLQLFADCKICNGKIWMWKVSAQMIIFSYMWYAYLIQIVFKSTYWNIRTYTTYSAFEFEPYWHWKVHVCQLQWGVSVDLHVSLHYWCLDYKV